MKYGGTNLHSTVAYPQRRGQGQQQTGTSKCDCTAQPNVHLTQLTVVV